MWLKLQEIADLVKFIQESFNWKRHFLCSEIYTFQASPYPNKFPTICDVSAEFLVMNSFFVKIVEQKLNLRFSVESQKQTNLSKWSYDRFLLLYSSWYSDVFAF